ncbi:hypothetical protein DFJ58DRAFT_768021 [Suillus subalutaceus]|uniref:uncharacterized protein n=1 Tax=Suillus subalutaceus TaxID=48586 RepID=UPI001B85CD79|nr:uncharacterized protein DFJ58DRAFT_768021 [Suillus subalutaceus]KAG1867832.1 hypothetical protein DFJ58DRAFT_768021 [Suillus subalutaceus]
MLVFATPNNYHYPSVHVNPYAAQQRAWALQQQRLRNQSISNALSMNGLLNRVPERDDYLHTQSPYYGYTTNDLAEYEYELALSRASRKAAIQQLHHDYNAAIRRRYAAFQAQRKEQEMDRQLRARRRAAEANRFLANAQTLLGAYWPCGLPVDAELPTLAEASTPKAPVQEASTSLHEGKGKGKEIPESNAESSVKDRLEERLMDQYQSELSNIFESILAGVSEDTSSDTPFEHVPVTSAAAASTQVNVNEEGTTSSHKGKGKAKEVVDSDAEEEPYASPARVASSLSQITSIVSRLEALVAGFQFPAELDFSPSRSPSPAYSALDTDDVFALTYTATNAPLRAQEHALSLLLGDLDNVPSFGSHVVRDARRAVVARVGEALEELERGVEERRGRARARRADAATVAVPVEQSSEPENLTAADLAPIQVPVIDEVRTNVFVPVEVLAPAASSPIEAITDTRIEAPAASIEIATASVAEPSLASSASLPTSSSESSQTLTAEEVSVPQEEESEGPLVDGVSTVSVSEDTASEDTETIESTTHADFVQASSPSARHQTPPPLDTSDSHSQITLGVSPPVSIPDFETLTHADADIPAEVADTATADEPATFAPAAAASSSLGSDHEQTGSEVNVTESDSESYSSVESSSEAEEDTFLLL